jgi:hypothetical protein
MTFGHVPHMLNVDMECSGEIESQAPYYSTRNVSKTNVVIMLEIASKG